MCFGGSGGASQAPATAMPALAPFFNNMHALNPADEPALAERKRQFQSVFQPTVIGGTYDASTVGNTQTLGS